MGCSKDNRKSSYVCENIQTTRLTTRIRLTKRLDKIKIEDVRLESQIKLEEYNINSLFRFIANPVEITGSGIIKSLGIPKMSDLEVRQVDHALNELYCSQKMVNDWYSKYCSSTEKLDACQTQFFNTRLAQRFEDCAYAAL